MLQQPYCQYTQRLLDKLTALNEKAKDKIDLEQIKKAIWYAITYHGEQKRDSGEPFYSHPLEVAYMVSDHLFKTDAIIISVLHDTIEDTELTRKMIEAEFGQKIADGVYDLTRIKEDGTKIGADTMVNQLYLEKKNDLLIIKLFDRVHNMRSIYLKTSGKIKKNINQTVQVFILTSAHLCIPEIEEELTKICIVMSDNSRKNYQRKRFSFLDNTPRLFPVFQNEINQSHILGSQAS